MVWEEAALESGTGLGVGDAEMMVRPVGGLFSEEDFPGG